MQVLPSVDKSYPELQEHPPSGAEHICWHPLLSVAHILQMVSVVVVGGATWGCEESQTVHLTQVNGVAVTKKDPTWQAHDSVPPGYPVHHDISPQVFWQTVDETNVVTPLTPVSTTILIGRSQPKALDAICMDGFQYIVRVRSDNNGTKTLVSMYVSKLD